MLARGRNEGQTSAGRNRIATKTARKSPCGGGLRSRTISGSRATANAERSRMKRIGMISLGCPKNLVDSEVMMGVLRRHGYDLTNDPEQADVLVINTCGFIDAAKQESVDTILEMAELKKSGSLEKLVVAG